MSVNGKNNDDLGHGERRREKERSDETEGGRLGSLKTETLRIKVLYGVKLVSVDQRS